TLCVRPHLFVSLYYFFFQAEDGIRDFHVTGVQTCALPISDATLGEISAALEEAFGRYGTLPTPVRGVYSQSYAGDARYAQVAAENGRASCRHCSFSADVDGIFMEKYGRNCAENVFDSVKFE